MLKIDLAIEAAAEARRLASARAWNAEDSATIADEPLICVTRRNAVRRVLRGRILVIWRFALNDEGGRLVESTLVAFTAKWSGVRIDLRHVEWSSGAMTSLVSGRCADWRGVAEDTLHRFTATRAARERAIATAFATSAVSFQAGLFDGRAAKAHRARASVDAHLNQQLLARANAVTAAGAFSVRPPELLLVLIPRDALRM